MTKMLPADRYERLDAALRAGTLTLAEAAELSADLRTARTWIECGDPEYDDAPTWCATEQEEAEEEAREADRELIARGRAIIAAQRREQMAAMLNRYLHPPRNQGAEQNPGLFQ